MCGLGVLKRVLTLSQTKAWYYVDKGRGAGPLFNRVPNHVPLVLGDFLVTKEIIVEENYFIFLDLHV